MSTERFWLTGRGLALVLGVYMLLHLVLRLSLSDVLLVDDAQQVVFSQTWSLGYNVSQPPLFTWLALPLFALFGPGLLALSLLKYTLLAASGAYLYAAARLVFDESRLAAWLVLSFLLISPFAWRLHEGFTHTMLLTLACSAVFYHLLRLRRRGGLADYLWLGLWLGVGLLSKYSFPLFALPMFAAALAVPGFRDRLLDRRAWWTLALAVALALPHYLWVLDNLDDLRRYVSRLAAGEQAGVVAGLARGVGSLLKSVLYYLTPLWLFLLLCFPRAWWPPRLPDTPEARLLSRFFVFAAILMLVLILDGAVNYKARWMHPLLLPAPFLLFLLLQGAEREGRTGPRGWRALGAGIVLISLLVIGVRVAQVTVFPAHGRYERVVYPMRELAEDIAALGFRTGTIVSSANFIGAHLLQRFPRARVISATSPEYRPPLRGQARGQCLAVWPGGGESVPKHIARVLREELGVDPDGARPGSLRRPMRGGGKDYVIGYLLLQGQGNCR